MVLKITQGTFKSELVQMKVYHFKYSILEIYKLTSVNKEYHQKYKIGLEESLLCNVRLVKDTTYLPREKFWD